MKVFQYQVDNYLKDFLNKGLGSNTGVMVFLYVSLKGIHNTPVSFHQCILPLHSFSNLQAPGENAPGDMACCVVHRVSNLLRREPESPW